MKLSKTLKLALNMLLHSKLRSWLTVIGIFIGVASVVAIISLGQGLQQNVNSRISGLGQDIITVTSGSSRAGGFGGFGGGGEGGATNIKPLTDSDLQALKLVPGIKFINGVVSGRATISYQSQNISLSVQGDDPSVFKEFLTTSLDSGRYLTSGDTGSIVIGSGVAHGTFRNDIAVGSALTIGGRPFRVVGVLVSSAGVGGSDRTIAMTSKDARSILSSTSDLKSNEYSSISIKVVDAQNINETTNLVDAALANSHHVPIGREDFSVTSAQALQQRFSSVTAGISLFLGVIAAVSLLVGSIGVANTMFTSVLEKTRDIGIMKAIGARNSDILLMFLANSGMLGAAGGIFGIAFAYVIAGLVPLIGLRLGQGTIGTITISPWLSLFAIVFSVALGMAAGAIPAYNASKLNPVEALRYE